MMSGEALTTQTSAMPRSRGEIILVNLKRRDSVVREYVEKLGAADAEDFRALALRYHAHFVPLGNSGTLQFLGELGRASAQHGKCPVGKYDVHGDAHDRSVAPISQLWAFGFLRSG